MKPYAKPALHELGRMDAVTRKSGPITDIDTQQAGSNLPAWQQFLCTIWPFDFCIADGGAGAPNQQGSGSFNA